MELSTEIILVLCCVYFAAGFVDSIAGGGGLLSLPAFLLTGTPPDIAIGTNKLAACCGMTAATINYARFGFIPWRQILYGLPPSFIGGFLGSASILYFDSSTIGKIIVFLLPFGVLATFMPKKDQGSRELTKLGSYILMPLICFVLGFYEGFFGPGVGSFLILSLHYILGFGLLQSSAISKVFNLAAMVCGLSVFIWQGKALFLVAIPLGAANICGSIVGSRMAMRIGSGFIRKVLTFSLCLLFVSLAWKFWLT